MSIEELKKEWLDRDVVSDSQEHDELREDAVPLYRAALDDFLGGSTDLIAFRAQVDSLGKSHGWWGFRGTGQMFFNQLVKAADPEALTTALRAALPPPANVTEAQACLDDFLAAVDVVRDRAATTGATKPGRGRVNFFVTFFWELADRETWPTFFPNSRDVLEAHGLLDPAQEQPPLYIDYRTRMLELKETLGTNTWGAEHLLWKLGKGAEPPPPEPAVIKGETTSLYAGYRNQNLRFPDEIVTSVVLSLATKRFLILSGRSGTGKTQIALGLARHLEAVDTAAPALPPAAPPPTNDDTNVYVPLTAPKLQRARTTLDAPARAIIDAQLGLPDRGTSKRFAARLPDGTIGQLRLNNLGFTDESRQLYLLFFLKDVRDWLNAHAVPADYLRLNFGDTENADLELNIVRGTGRDASEVIKRFELIAVRSDWTDPRGLIGYVNPITNTYVSTPLVELLLVAAGDLARPYFVILDEMNLARVEYYFSDFLSALESGEPIELMSASVEEELLARGHDDVPARLVVPPNVSFIGTVNIDESTHAFSPKVLDRANVIEFSDVDVESALGHPVDDTAVGLRLKAGTLDPAWLCTTRAQALAARTAAHGVESFTSALEDVHDLLERSHRHFGYRVIGEISAFVGHALATVDGDPEFVAARAFDLQLLQKIIPKLTGGRELETPLAQLLQFCRTGEKQITVDADAERKAAVTALEAGTTRHPASTRKLLRMLDRLADVGFVGALE